MRGVFAYVHLARGDPEGVVHDAVHDRVSVDSSAEAGVPVLLRVLGAEHRGDRVVAALEQLEQHGTDLVAGLVQQPFIEDQDRERGVLPQPFLSAAGLVLGRGPGLLEVGHPDVVRAVAVLAGALGQRGSEIRLPGSGEALEHHVLSSLDEGAGPQLGEDAAI